VPKGPEKVRSRDYTKKIIDKNQMHAARPIGLRARNPVLITYNYTKKSSPNRAHPCVNFVDEHAKHIKVNIPLASSHPY
jgi:hypothetical protein